MADWSKLLQALGFSQSESDVYLAALELGPSPVQSIAKKADVSRVTSYAVIEKLTDDGLMSSVTRGKKQYYTAESPERLLSYMKSKANTLQATLKEFQSSLADLKLLESGDRPTVKHFEGLAGIEALTEDLLTEKPDTVFEIANLNEVLTKLSKSFLRKFGNELDARGIKFQSIYIASPDYKGRKRVRAKILSPDKYDFSGDIIAFGNKLAMINYKGKIEGIAVSNKELTQTFITVFKLAWASL